MEAVGFEPTSENLQPEARYMLVPSFESRLIRRLGESFGIGQPGLSHPSAPDDAERPARLVTSFRPLRRQPGDALLVFKQRVPVRYWQLLFAMCLTGPMAPRHATPDLLIPVEACRPLSCNK